MGYEDTSGLNIKKNYGPESTEAAALSGGYIHKFGTTYEGVVYVDGKCLTTGGKDTKLVIPKGARVESVYFKVKEAFALGGTNPTIAIGVKSSEAVNHLAVVTEAQAEAVGNYVDVAAGVFTDPLTADKAISINLGGTNPTITSEGRLKLVVKYQKIV